MVRVMRVSPREVPSLTSESYNCDSNRANDKQDRDQAVGPIKQSTMPWKKVTQILHACSPLHPAFEEVASLGNHRNERPRWQESPERCQARRRFAAAFVKS